MTSGQSNTDISNAVSEDVLRKALAAVSGSGNGAENANAATSFDESAPKPGNTIALMSKVHGENAGAVRGGDGPK